MNADEWKDGLGRGGVWWKDRLCAEAMVREKGRSRCASMVYREISEGGCREISKGVHRDK